MARPKKLMPESDASGEDFSDIDANSASSSESSDGDYEVKVPQENWNIPIIGPRAERSEYTVALKQAQLKINELQLLVRTLSARNMDLAVRLKQFKKHKPTTNITTVKTSAKDKLSEEDQRIAQAAKHFGIMHEQFIPHSAFLAPQPAIRSTDPSRYGSEESKVAGITAELYEVVPADLHKPMSKSVAFRTLFIKQLSNGRRSMIHQLRSKTASDIFSHASRLYHPTFDRGAVEVFCKELLFENETKYSKFAPILFPKVESAPGSGIYVRKRKMKNLFHNIELTKMLKAVLFGPSSLTSNKRPSPKTQGMVWGVKFVTPGAIALMAILAIFLHSPDQEFGPVGAKSDIPYEKWFNHYKKFLMDNASEPEIANLFMWWNARVFPANGKNHVTAKAFELNAEYGDSSGMEEARQGLCSSGDEDSNHELASMPSKRRAVDRPDLEISQDDQDMIAEFNQLTFDSDKESDQMPEPQDIAIDHYDSESFSNRPESSSQVLAGSERDDPIAEPIAEASSKSKKPITHKVGERSLKSKKGKGRVNATAISVDVDPSPEVQVVQEKHTEKVIGRKTTRKGKK